MTREEKLIFEISTPGARAVDTPPCDVPHSEIDPSIASFVETELPEVGQLDLVRHYTRLTNRLFCVDTTFYPLGACTMKYTPKVNERLAHHSGWEWSHPLQSDGDCQGSLALLYQLRVMLQEIAGLHEVCLLPAAGAHGQWAVLRMVLSYMHDWGQPHRRTVLMPETAHGTHPASAAAAGATVLTVRSDEQGLLDLAHLRQRLSDHDVAAMMIAQPNFAGKFDPNFREIVDAVHDAGAMVYLDGANLNAMLGVARAGDLGVDAMHFGTHLSLGTPHGCGGPGAGPIAVNEKLAPYLPVPQVVEREPGRYAWDDNRPKSIGPIHAFFGQFTVLVRAYAYLRSIGSDGLRHVSETAVLCANYLAQRIRDAYPLPYGPPPGAPMASNPCAHGFVAVPRSLLDRGVSTLDVAKALIDRGYHPPTVHWPIPDSLTIEPTETESKLTLDEFADALLEIAALGAKDPAALRQAPTNAPVRRVDEIAAARTPVLTWKSGTTPGDTPPAGT
jgi:glycine dehydrogenase subunit 2